MYMYTPVNPPLALADAALYERAQIGYYNNSEEREKAYYVGVFFVLFLLFLN